MTKEEIKTIIAEEIKNHSDFSNAHGVDLNRCLIEPIKQTYLSSTDPNVSFELWTVLEESEDKTGYKITFDQDDKTFGLGILTDKDELVDIGTYGSFMDTLKGM